MTASLAYNTKTHGLSSRLLLPPFFVWRGRFVGLFNTLFLLPVIPILHYLGIETFQLPNRRDEWMICGINMVITLSSDYLYVLSMLKTTPLGKRTHPPPRKHTCLFIRPSYCV